MVTFSSILREAADLLDEEAVEKYTTLATHLRNLAGILDIDTLRRLRTAVQHGAPAHREDVTAIQNIVRALTTPLQEGK